MKEAKLEKIVGVYVSCPTCGGAGTVDDGSNILITPNDEKVECINCGEVLHIPNTFFVAHSPTVVGEVLMKDGKRRILNKTVTIDMKNYGTITTVDGDVVPVKRLAGKLWQALERIKQ